MHVISARMGALQEVCQRVAVHFMIASTHKGGGEMTSVVNAAVAEMFVALIIWALIERYGMRGKREGWLRTIGLFVVIWIALAALHLMLLRQTESDRIDAKLKVENAAAIDAKQVAATLAANKPQLEAILGRIAQGGSVDRQTHDRFWSLMPQSTPEDRQELMSSMMEGVPHGMVLSSWTSGTLSFRR